MYDGKLIGIVAEYDYVWVVSETNGVHFIWMYDVLCLYYYSERTARREESSTRRYVQIYMYCMRIQSRIDMCYVEPCALGDLVIICALLRLEIWQLSVVIYVLLIAGDY